MVRKVIAVDSQYAYRESTKANFQFFPVEEFRELVNGDEGVDVIETVYTLIKKVPEDDSAEALATVASQVDRIQHALEMKGCRVIVCPAKRTPDGGYKQSDDQRLMIKTLSICLKLRPDFLVFVGADGDYAPMMWELRAEGVRVEVVANSTSLATDLRRVAHSVVDLDEVFGRIKRGRG